MGEAAGTSDEIPPDLLRQARLFSEVLRGMDPVASYELPDGMRARFLALWQYSCIDHPKLLDRLLPTDGARRNWHDAFVNAVLGDVQEGVAAMEFHLEEIRVIESQLVAGISAAAQRLHVDEPLTGAGGNSRRLDFAYQAHIFAARRTLEYFAGFVTAFFKQENPGFRHLAERLSRARPVELRDAALSALRDHDVVRDRVLSEGNTRSVRDCIAHWNTVPAGVVNVHIDADGGCRVFLAGGGENLDGFELTSLTALADALEQAADEMVDMIFDTYAALNLLPTTDPSAS